MKSTLIRITTVPLSLDKLLGGQLNFMSSYFNVIAVASDKEYLDKIGRKEDVEVFNLEMTRKITPFKDIIAVIKLALFLKRNKPFIVHTHTPKAGVVGMLAAKLAGIPHRLHTVAGLPLLEASGGKRKLLDIVEKVTYACATKVYPNSSGLKKIIIEQLYCKPAKLKVIGNGSSNGINTDYFDSVQVSNEEKQSLKANLGITPADFVFVFVGRLVGDKGINELIQAFQKIAAVVKPVKLLLVGPLEEELDPLEPGTLQEITAHENIIVVGFQQDVRPYFAVSNVLVFPSYREGFPNVVMQAGAMGLPAIVTDINGCNEIIEEGENGLIIPVRDSEGLENAMLSLMNDKVLYQRMQANSRALIKSRFEQQVVWDALLAEYKELEGIDKIG